MNASSQPDPQRASSAVGSAYDAIAGRYDEAVAEDAWMRRLLWRHYTRAFSPGDRVLDLACGTGLDSLFLAGEGIEVVSVDVSTGMVARLREKARRAGSGRRILASVQDADRLALHGEGTFDGAISAFAGLNTVRDLGALARALGRLIRPGGRFIGHVLAPTDGAVVKTVTISGSAIPHALASASEVYGRHFADVFHLRRSYALGFLWPQSWSARLPGGFTRLAGRLEPALGAFPPFRRWGRFFVLDLERRSTPVAAAGSPGC